MSEVLWRISVSARGLVEVGCLVCRDVLSFGDAMTQIVQARQAHACRPLPISFCSSEAVCLHLLDKRGHQLNADASNSKRRSITIAGLQVPGGIILRAERRGDECLRKEMTQDLPSEGCSKPRSEMARRSSGFKRKSLWKTNTC